MYTVPGVSLNLSLKDTPIIKNALLTLTDWKSDAHRYWDITIQITVFLDVASMLVANICLYLEQDYKLSFSKYLSGIFIKILHSGL